MDSNLALLSPRGCSDIEPELVPENTTFCLDGSRPVNPPPPPRDREPNSHHYTPEQGSFLAMRKGLGSSERSHARTDTTSGSSESTGTIGAISSSSTLGVLASPVTSQTKNALTQSPAKDLYIDNVPAAARESEQDEEEDHDFYTNQQTPPSFPPQEMVMAVALKRPLLNKLSPLLGTPPTSLHAEAMIPSRSSTVSAPAGGRNGKESSNDNHLGLSISPVYPTFPMDGVTPPNGHQPILYSAIGSLEQCSAHSLKSMWNNIKLQQPQQNSKNRLCSRFDTTNLIAPTQQNNPRPQSTGEKALEPYLSSHKTKAKSEGSNVGKGPATSTPDKFGDSTGSVRKFSPSMGGPPQPAPPTKQYQLAFEASFQKVLQKVDAAQNKNQRNKKTPPASEAEKSDAAALHSNAKPASSMRKGSFRQQLDGPKEPRKTVQIDDASLQRTKRSSSKKKPTELFRPSCDAYTPRMERKKITYKPAEQRTPVQKMATTMGTLSRPNFRDALRRVAMLIRQHIVKIEQRFSSRPNDARDDEGLFKMSMKEAFAEERFATCRYKCTIVRVPMARPGMVFGLKKVRPKYEIPTEEEIYEFAHQLFKTVQLSSECSIVCLIYIERLMERAKVPLLASTWRPIFLCGLLLASKVWQDLSSWNIEFASVYPQFSLDAINKLELQFLQMVKWDLYISSSLYAKYYFALRSLVEKPDFRQRYNRMVGGVDSVAASEALKIQKRTEQIKEEALMQLSRSM